MELGFEIPDEVWEKVFNKAFNEAFEAMILDALAKGTIKVKPFSPMFDWLANQKDEKPTETTDDKPNGVPSKYSRIPPEGHVSRSTLPDGVTPNIYAYQDAADHSQLFRCTVCGHAFKAMRGLSAHVRVIHGGREGRTERDFREAKLHKIASLGKRFKEVKR